MNLSNAWQQDAVEDRQLAIAINAMLNGRIPHGRSPEEPCTDSDAQVVANICRLLMSLDSSEDARASSAPTAMSPTVRPAGKPVLSRVGKELGRTTFGGGPVLGSGGGNAGEAPLRTFTGEDAAGPSAA